MVKPSEYHAADDAEAGADLHRGGPAARRVQRRAPASARAPARCWPNMPDINKLVLTGGTEAGRIAGSAAANVFAHQTMELGGKTPVMVFDDFDVDSQPSTTPAFGAFIGAGTDLASAPRAISCRPSIYDEFVEKLKAKTQNHPRSAIPSIPQPSSDPVISARQRDRVLTLSRQYGREDGARLVTGGVAAQVPGHENGYLRPADRCSPT